jgi:hypothetical protein
VYADSKPITSSSLKGAQLIARIPEGSRECRWKRRASAKLQKMAFRYAPHTAAWGMWGHSGTSNTTLMRRDEALPAFANASCNTRLNSGFRIVGKSEKVESRTIAIKEGALTRCPYSKDGNFPPDLADKTLVVCPHDRVRTWSRIASSTPTTVTIKDGDLVAYAPPINSWTITVWKRENRREPTPEDLKALAREKKRWFLICDGEPRGRFRELPAIAPCSAPPSGKGRGVRSGPNR